MRTPLGSDQLQSRLGWRSDTMKSLMRGAALAVMLSTAAVAAHAQAPTIPTEVIRGTALNLSAFGEVRTAPDMATITLGVNTQGSTAEAAMRANATAMN